MKLFLSSAFLFSLVEGTYRSEIKVRFWVGNEFGYPTAAPAGFVDLRCLSSDRLFVVGVAAPLFLDYSCTPGSCN